MTYTAARISQCALALLIFSSQTMADGFYDQEDALRLRLRNELRRADRPSAGAASNIYAWVQGGALEYNSKYIGDRVGLDVGAFYVHGLDTRDDWSTRWYLDGQKDYSLYTAALKVKLTDHLKVKVGRMVTDSAYAGEADIPLINTSSQRTSPSMSDAVLFQYTPHAGLDVYGMYRVGVYNYPDVSQGVHKAGPLNPSTFTNDTLRPQYLAAARYTDALSLYSIGTSWQRDVASQMMANFSKRFPLDASKGSYLKLDTTAFYAKLNGISETFPGASNSYLLGAQLTYADEKRSLFFGVGKVGPKFNFLSGVDTDRGFVFDLSIDRNYSNMWSGQMGTTRNIARDVFVGIAEIATDGYEDYRQLVKVRGLATDLLLGYNPQSGSLKGLRSLLILNSAREQRPGSTLGNRLDYFDIKLTIQYDFNLR